MLRRITLLIDYEAYIKHKTELVRNGYITPEECALLLEGFKDALNQFTDFKHTSKIYMEYVNAINNLADIGNGK